MHTVSLYSTTDDSRKAVKTLTFKKTLSILPTENIDLIRPVFKLNYDTTVLTSNYLYSSLTNRYYFINTYTISTGQVMYISCTCDVLYSHYTELLNCSSLVLRSESVGKPTCVADSQLPVDNTQKQYRVIAFNPVSDYPFTRPNPAPYLLEVI